MISDEIEIWGEGVLGESIDSVKIRVRVPYYIYKAISKKGLSFFCGVFCYSNTRLISDEIEILGGESIDSVRIRVRVRVSTTCLQ